MLGMSETCAKNTYPNLCYVRLICKIECWMYMPEVIAIQCARGTCQIECEKTRRKKFQRYMSDRMPESFRIPKRCSTHIGRQFPFLSEAKGCTKTPTQNIFLRSAYLGLAAPGCKYQSQLVGNVICDCLGPNHDIIYVHTYTHSNLHVFLVCCRVIS